MEEGKHRGVKKIKRKIHRKTSSGVQSKCEATRVSSSENLKFRSVVSKQMAMIRKARHNVFRTTFRKLD